MSPVWWHRRHYRNWYETVPNPLEKVYLPNLYADVPFGTFVILAEDKYIGRIVRAQQFSTLPHTDKILADQMTGYTTESRKDLFVQVNIFERRETNLDNKAHESSSSEDEEIRNDPMNLPEIDQTLDFFWVRESVIEKLAFVFHTSDIKGARYDGMYMKYAYQCQYRTKNYMSNASREYIESSSVISFPSLYSAYQLKYKGRCFSHAIFNTILCIRGALQHMLCRAAQSQGTANSSAVFASPEFWYYIKHYLKDHMDADTLKKRMKVIKLDHGLKYYAEALPIEMEQLSFDSETSMDLLRGFIGGVGVCYGVRKRRPRYLDGAQEINLHLSDSINYVDTWNNKPPTDGSPMRKDRSRKRIDLTYNHDSSQLWVYVSYSNVTVTEETIKSARLDSVGIMPTTPPARVSGFRIEDLNVGADFVYPFLKVSKTPVRRILYRITRVEKDQNRVIALRLCANNPDGSSEQFEESDDNLVDFDDPSVVLQAVNAYLEDVFEDNDD